jgi:ssRNA-specific RNase YbeY (16S rRNA maturation enzyme)
MAREVAFLTAHAALHLLGFDHLVPGEEKKMIAEQDSVLNGLGITRDFSPDKKKTRRISRERPR